VEWASDFRGETGCGSRPGGSYDEARRNEAQARRCRPLSRLLVQAGMSEAGWPKRQPERSARMLGLDRCPMARSTRTSKAEARAGAELECTDAPLHAVVEDDGADAAEGRSDRPAKPAPGFARVEVSVVGRAFVALVRETRSSGCFLRVAAEVHAEIFLELDGHTAIHGRAPDR